MKKKIKLESGGEINIAETNQRCKGVLPDEIEPTENEKKWYLQGFQDAIACAKSAINVDLQDLIHNTIVKLAEDIEESINVSVDYFLPRD